MGNVSYIFGNGLDMQLGLPTQFLDFYNWTLTNYKDTENMFIPINNDLINKKSEWADFETKLVDVISKFLKITLDESLIEKYREEMEEDFTDIYDRYKNSGLDANDFIDNDFNDFISLFQDYIKIINDSLTKQDSYKETLEKINDDLKKVTRLIEVRHKVLKPIKENITKNRSMPKSFNYFTLNYTNVVSDLGKTLETAPSIKVGKDSLLFRKGRKSYLHGFLPRKGMMDGIVIGTYSIDDFDKSIRHLVEPEDFCKFDYISDAFQREPYSSLIETLTDDHCIICYGLHLGNSDTKLKEIIFNNLAKYKDNILVYYKYEHISGGRLPKKERAVIRKTKAELLEGVSEEIKSSIQERIYVIPIRADHNLINESNIILTNEDRSNILNTKPVEQL